MTTKAELIKVIEKLENNPHSWGEIVGESSAVVAGGVALAASAVPVAGFLGVTSIPCLTTMGSWVGLTIVSATPVGWIVGLGAVGAAAAFAIARGLSSAGEIKAKKKHTLEYDRQQLRSLENTDKHQPATQEQKARLARALKHGLVNDWITVERCAQFLDQMTKHSLLREDVVRLMELMPDENEVDIKPPRKRRSTTLTSSELN